MTESMVGPDAAEATGRKFSVGDIVHDQDADADEQTGAYVTTLPDATAEEWVAYEDKEGTETTVAEDNPDYPVDAPVVVVVHTTDVHYDLPDWNRYTRLSVSELEEADTLYYGFPAPRLVRDQHRPHAPETQKGESGANESVERTTSGSNSDTEADASSDPSAALVALQRYLETSGMDTTIADDGKSVRVTKANESYRVSLDGVEGDGPHRSQLEEAIEKVRAATQAMTE
ncbi:hypothetical protein [Halococcus thailandensis]|uniref:Uncharacterized protein n=1 Tax=Halococcus thailandensis JCM 13552 TaxID=1227457 RepID=M0NF84_9EURY|nr:hypothetical protein [Halococcus thailandensis]EMA55355.1 hypothetical protein C451_05303 [Halococcus thailandensis JCM 13552]